MEVIDVVVVLVKLDDVIAIMDDELETMLEVAVDAVLERCVLPMLALVELKGVEVLETDDCVMMLGTEVDIVEEAPVFDVNDGAATLEGNVDEVEGVLEPMTGEDIPELVTKDDPAELTKFVVEPAGETDKVDAVVHTVVELETATDIDDAKTAVDGLMELEMTRRAVDIDELINGVVEFNTIGRVDVTAAFNEFDRELEEELAPAGVPVVAVVDPGKTYTEVVPAEPIQVDVDGGEDNALGLEPSCEVVVDKEELGTIAGLEAEGEENTVPASAREPRLERYLKIATVDSTDLYLHPYSGFPPTSHLTRRYLSSEPLVKSHLTRRYWNLEPWIPLHL